jgi:HEAT repeat protein|tara:strand:- start:271 stop:528 length:258 start_codon:yes stop_codon:yes gene_type:complete
MTSPTPAIENELQMLEDSDRRARKRGLEELSTLGPAALKRQARAVVARLVDSDWRVRKEALETLGRLEPATLSQHADAVVAGLED